jgi:triacylglycerol lipase
MRTDFDPKALKRGVGREGLAYLAQAALFGLGYLPSRHRPRRAKEQRTVVFVHGLGGNRSSFFPLQGYLRLFGYDRQLSLNHATGPSIEAMAQELAAHLKREVRGGRIDIVAHSLGGVVARYYVQALGGDRRVDRLITLASPHHGSHPSVYIPTALLWQLKPDGEFLQHLNGLPPPPHTRLVSFAADEDHVVLPPHSALAPFGERHALSGLGHQSILLSPRVFRAVRETLEQPLESLALPTP